MHQMQEGRAVAAPDRDAAPEVLRYGVHRIGATWFLIGNEGSRLGFPSRDKALMTARLLCVRSAAGSAVELVAEDSRGRIKTDMRLDRCAP